MTKTGDAALPPMDLDADSLMDTIRARSREITIGVIALAALGVIYVLVDQSNQKKQARAEIALNQAENSFYGGNMALATTDLQKLVQGYGSTSAGVQGSMLLAQSYYKAGKFDEGIKVLQAAQSSSGAKSFQASIEALMGAGYADNNKLDEAAKHYRAAADRAGFPADKDLYLADAARTLMAAGKKDDALKIWQSIASNTDSPVMAEAKVRVGELTAAAAK